MKKAYEEGLVDKLVPGYSTNRVRWLKKEKFGDPTAYYGSEKPTFRFKREAQGA